jgi:hypothetical protein
VEKYPWGVWKTAIYSPRKNRDITGDPRIERDGDGDACPSSIFVEAELPAGFVQWWMNHA